MKIIMDEEAINRYEGKDREAAEKVRDDLVRASRLLEENPDFDLTVAQLEVLEKLAGATGVPDMDLFYVYCMGFAKGADFGKKSE